MELEKVTTLFEVTLSAMKASAPGNAEATTPTHGTSYQFLLRNICGACPSRASAYNVLLY